MTDTDVAAIVASIREQRANAPLSILTLAEPLLSENNPASQQANSPSFNKSSATNDSSANSDHGNQPLLTPATLAADLQHYRDLFSKLRFSYLEQVTKEKYLRSIVGDSPVLYTAAENVALEDKLAGMKAELKAKKEQSEALVETLRELAARLAERWKEVDGGLERLEALPAEVQALEQQVEELRAAVEEKEREMDVDLHVDGDGVDAEHMNMSLADTRSLVDSQRSKIDDVDAQIAALQAQLPGKMRECEKAERELEELEVQRNEATRLARESQRVREEGGRDALEDQGRWLRGEEAVLRGLLGIGVEG